MVREMQLFDVAILFVPTDKQREDGQGESVVLAPTSILAKNEQDALFQVATRIPDEFKDKTAQLEVAVRPF